MDNRVPQRAITKIGVGVKSEMEGGLPGSSQQGFTHGRKESHSMSVTQTRCDDSFNVEPSRMSQTNGRAWIQSEGETHSGADVPYPGHTYEKWHRSRCPG